MKNFEKQTARRPGVRGVKPVHLATLLAALALSACGGGGGNPGTPSGGSGAGSTGSGGTVAVATPASVQFVLAAPADKSIVIKGQGGNGRTETATLTFKVVDTLGNALPNQKVTFSVSPATAAIALNTKEATTDASGQVIATVNSGSVPTTFRIQATLPGTAAAGKADISTLSDTITVTTGLPTQRSFSMSVDVFNPEGLEFDSTPTTAAARIQVLLADAFGNPVPDGTPIVFQTSAGSVGSADRGGCTTVNGGCSVDFRAQNPRVPTPGQPATPCNTTGTDGKGTGIVPDVDRPGVATVCASSTDGAATLFGRTAIFLSGSSVASVYLNSIDNPLDLSKEVDLGSIAAGATKTFWLQLNDEYKNPMPAGSTVAVTALVNATAAAVSPAKVPNVALYSNATKDPSGASGYAQGSWHKFEITGTSGGACPGTGMDARFNLTVTTPGTTASAASGATTTDIPFKLSVTCP